MILDAVLLALVKIASTKERGVVIFPKMRITE